MHIPQYATVVSALTAIDLIDKKDYLCSAMAALPAALAQMLSSSKAQARSSAAGT
jgi:hypothetical protein